jgi:MFS family permease
LLWAGEAMSDLGSGAALLAYPLLVLELTRSASAAGLVMSAAMIARLLASLPGGVLVDRLDKRRLMISCDLARAAGQAGLVAGLSTHRGGLWLVIGVAAADNALGSPFGSAQTTAVRHLVAPDQLRVALSRVHARQQAAMLAGPPLGGLLLAVAPGLPFLANCVSYLVSACCLLPIRTPMRPAVEAQAPGSSPAESSSARSSSARSSPAGSSSARSSSARSSPAGYRSSGYRALLAGLRWLWHVPFLRVTLLLIAGTNLASNSLILVAIVAAHQRGATAPSTGLLLTLASVGGLVGALIAPVLVRRLSIRAILVANRCLWAGLIPLLLLVHDVYAVGGLIGAMFLLGPTGSTAVTIRRMAITPDDLQGRVNSASGLCAGIAAPAGTVAIGYALAHYGLTVAVLTLAGWMAALALVAASSAGVSA